jgi:hypothetical protein
MSTAPKWFSPVAVVALLWNLLGCVGWVMDMRATPEQVAAMGPAMVELYAALPPWLPTATGVAVLGGVAGCLGLLLRKRWATKLLWLSLLGVVAQDIALFVVAGGMALADPLTKGLQAAVLVVSILLVLLARRAERAGWLGV